MTEDREHPAEDRAPAPPGPAIVKLVPPRVPPWLVERPSLERRLDQADRYRLTVVVAGPGFGKSTQLGARALANGWAWYTVDRADRSPVTFAEGILAALRRRLPDLPSPVLPVSTGGDTDALGDGLASAVAHALEEALSEDLVLVVDDLHELEGAHSAVRFVESLVRYSPIELHLVVCSRHDIPFSVVRMRGRGEVLAVASAELAFTMEETTRRLATTLQSVDPALVSSLHEASGGWPAAVQLAADVLATAQPEDGSKLLEGLSRRGGPLFQYLAEEVFGRESPETQALLRVSAQLDRVTPELCEALEVTHARETLVELARRGLVSASPAGTGDSYTLHALVREFVVETWPTSVAEVRELRCRAAEWFESSGQHKEALESLTVAADGARIVRFIERRWRELTDQAALDALVEAGAVLPVALRRPPSALTIAHAHILRGKSEQALEWLASSRGADADDPWPMFQVAMVHITRDEPSPALEALLRALDGELKIEQAAMVDAFIAYQLMALGRLDEARPYAAQAFEAAYSLPETMTAQAEAHMALGDIAREDGDLAAAAAHYETALEISEGLGNVLATCSARTRRSMLRVAQGLLTEALDDAAHAVTLADRVGFSLFQAWAPSTRGVAYLALGRLDEAAADFSVAREVQDRLGSSAVSISLAVLGSVHRARGEIAQARSAYERALVPAERSGCVYDRTVALAGLAWTLVDDDPEEAPCVAAGAVELSFGAGVAPALLTSGWLALRRGDVRAAVSTAEAALADASRRGAPGLLAEALELRALCESEPDRGRLEEAHAIWTRIGARLDEARTAFALAQLDGTTDERDDAERALRRFGVRRLDAGVGLVQQLLPRVALPLAIRTLGHFAVLRHGLPATATEWQSKKARDLLKILVAHRGQSLPRDSVMELLWPDEDPRKTSNRLSVALNVVRGVLDPERRLEQDHYVASDGDSIRLVLPHVSVDLEDFLTAAATGLSAFRQKGAKSSALLEQAEAAYGGDFLEEDRYEDWAAPRRDEVRAAYLEVLRALAALELSAEAPSARYHLRALSLDPYDEDTHLALVSALIAGGRHGEARRAYRQYVMSMRRIGVEPAPFESSRVGAAYSP
ncbi:hypothetical protein BH09ACT13_BH09ACT13_13570 [soil metagenome]